MPHYCASCGKARTIRSMLFEAVAAAGDPGVTVAEAAKAMRASERVVQAAAERLMSDGLAHRVTTLGRGRPLVLNPSAALYPAIEQGRPATPASE